MAKKAATAKRPQFRKITGDLNIVLTDREITSVLRNVLGPKGNRFPGLPGGGVMIASDHCCVDASVGSSVAGPFSGVASSVSIPAARVGGRFKVKSATVKQRVKAGEIKRKIKAPKKVKVT